ncbi:hypothetical protein Csa_000865 [Cucumis sativus]|nr:hypothetical protein Csa_000865 [Cucumis sativus]
MVKLTMIARVTDGLPLAEGLDDGRDLRDAEYYKQQAKSLFKNLSTGQNEPSRMSVETGAYVFQYPCNMQDCFPCNLRLEYQMPYSPYPIVVIFSFQSTLKQILFAFYSLGFIFVNFNKFILIHSVFTLRSDLNFF